MNNIKVLLLVLIFVLSVSFVTAGETDEIGVTVNIVSSSGHFAINYSDRCEIILPATEFRAERSFGMIGIWGAVVDEYDGVYYRNFICFIPNGGHGHKKNNDGGSSSDNNNDNNNDSNSGDNDLNNTTPSCHNITICDEPICHITYINSTVCDKHCSHWNGGVCPNGWRCCGDKKCKDDCRIVVDERLLCDKPICHIECVSYEV